MEAAAELGARLSESKSLFHDTKRGNQRSQIKKENVKG